MNPNREEALFALALEKLAEKRPAFLDAVCERDTALRARIEALLAAHEQPETPLATQAGRPWFKMVPPSGPGKVKSAEQFKARLDRTRESHWTA